MKLGDTISKSFKEYKKNFKLYSKIILLFIFIPSLIMLLFPLLFPIDQGSIVNLVIYNIIAFISIILYILASVSIIAGCLYEKDKYKDNIKLGKKYFWKYVLLMIVSLIFLIGLFILLIVPAIIFSVYWSVASFVLIAENKKIIPSLKGSYKLIKENWWRILGYGLVFSLVIWGVSIIFSIPSWPTGIMVGIDAVKNPTLYGPETAPTNILTIHTLISSFLSSLAQFITIPLGILFGKNIYKGLKKEK